MEYSLFISFFVISITSLFFIRKRRERNEKSKKLKAIQLKYKSNTFLYPSIFQSMLLSEGNNVFEKMYTILTLKKDFCLSQLLFSEQNEFVILKGFLKCMVPNFYINNVRVGGIHYARKYTTKSHNIKKYSVYGTINDKLREFCLKYDFAQFYCSYWPLDKKSIDFNINYNSVIYLECPLSLLNQEFVDDFFSLFLDIPSESTKKFEIEKKLIKDDLDKFKEYEKKDFVEKIVSGINQSSTKGAVIKKKNKKKK